MTEREVELPETVTITREQAVMLMAVSVALRDEDLAIRGYEEDEVDAATAAIRDVAEECALQLGGMS